jgi:hypothetical protein
MGERAIRNRGCNILQKSFWVLMSWQWKKGQALLLPPSLHNRHLFLTAGYDTQEVVEVPQISPYKIIPHLGCLPISFRWNGKVSHRPQRLRKGLCYPDSGLYYTAGGRPVVLSVISSPQTYLPHHCPNSHWSPMLSNPVSCTGGSLT